MDPYERLGISRTSSAKELEQAYEEKLAAHPDETEERTEIERAYVVIKYEKKQKQKRTKRGAGILGLLLVAGIGGGAYYYLGMEQPEAEKKNTSTNASFVIGEEEEAEDEKTSTKPKKDTKKEAEEAQTAEYEEVSDISAIFFRELEDALTNRTVNGLSVSTSQYNGEFQVSLDDLIKGDYIFDGELSIDPVAQDDVTVKGENATVKVTVNYSSRSYQPYLHERPEESTIVWELGLVKSGGDWLVNKRTALSDSAKGRGMEVREEVKDDIVSTIYEHATEWESAYTYKDTSYFTLFTSPKYLARQKAYYDTLEKRGVDWEGNLDEVQYSPASIQVSEVATSLTATIEAISYYDGDYYDEDGSIVEENPGKDVPFNYHLKYDLNQEKWLITSTDQLTAFSNNDTVSY